MSSAFPTPSYPKKLFYKINEVSEIVGVEAYVLRYWETKFPSLKPERLPNDERRYRAKDIDLLLRIRTLLYDEKFTIAGAVDRIRKDPKGAIDVQEASRVISIAPATPLPVPQESEPELPLSFETEDEAVAEYAIPVSAVKAKLSSLRAELIALRDAIPVAVH
ncbi:MerR family transcriptional regulator [Candidatus Sumerlaeota bacterium]|nr:MerR family transcriptional regulator [Candidatus Sumerlaeota bacterium]